MTTPVNALIIAAQQTLEYLDECLGEYDADSGPPPVELVQAAHELSQALTGLGRHPYDEQAVEANNDLPF